MEELCLFVISNFSFERAEAVIQKLVNVFVSKSVLHEIFKKSKCQINHQKQVVEEISLDGGNICLRSGDWKQYKAVRLNGEHYGAWYQKNDEMIDWIKEHKLMKPVTCIGDGHDGIWNIFGMIGWKGERREILDWYHLNENLYKQPLEEAELKEIESDLWNGRIGEAISNLKEGNNFRNYVLEHKARIVNYSYYQQEGITIGSGAVESAVKQINARLNLPGARWKEGNINKILSLRCTYLNST